MDKFDSLELPINYLSGSFEDTTNSYKFYWFISILESLNENNILLVEDLICNMISSVWYPVNYFHLSFGKQDQLSKIVLEIRSISNIPIDSSKEEINNEIKKLIKENSTINKLVQDLSKYVIYRFLRPWFTNELVGKKDTDVNKLIVSYSDRDFNSTQNPPMYRFILKDKLSIELNLVWFEYLKKNNKILKSFVFWELNNYLQKRNPNVPNISDKLVEINKRDLKKAKEFWKIVLSKDKINCIYSKEIIKTSFSIDHFIPWSFVTHDLLWNLIPTTNRVNSSKNNSLPKFDKYFYEFSYIQNKSFKIVYDENKNKLLEDYALLYKLDLDSIYNLSYDIFTDKLKSSLLPLFQIATNMGFKKDWSLD